MPRGRRCDLGCESWPDHDDYSTCPACGEATKPYRNLPVLDVDDARRLRLDLMFEEFYDKRCERLGITSDGPLRPLPIG